MNDFAKLEEKLGLEFKNKDLLTQAFVHRSYLNENPEFGLSNNERLEFLGDAILEHVVTEYLFLNYPKKAEGELTSLRAALVNTKMLSKVAQDMGFNEFLLLSAGEIKENGRARQYILADSFESFIGSLYLDQGIDICKDLIQKHLIKELPRVIEEGLFRDSKSTFQEKSQEKIGITPTYSVLKDWGPDHEKTFVVGVYLKDELIAEGQGSSKQEAEEKAAEKALRIKNW
jgi:ribonuclease III